LAPGLLLGQAIGRFGNFINQELYGPPTTLPWGIPIDASHRLPPWDDIAQFPVETTRFHPTFAYEALWNVILFAVLVFMVQRYGNRIRSGTMTGLWFIIAGIGRTWIEFFRPDQPRFFGTPVSTSTVVSIIFALVGIFIVLVKNEKINVGFMKPGTTGYTQKSSRRPQRIK
jgi:phosphatidylglycerol:prolipoprotein diacylglycerol transferase